MKTIINGVGILAIIVLIIWGINALHEKSVKEFQEDLKENRKRVEENFEKRHKVYLMAEKNQKAFKEELNKMISYLQEHPDIIEELKKYDWTKLKEQAASLDDLPKIYFKGVKSHLEDGSIIELYKQLISDSERITRFMAEVHFGTSYFERLTIGDPFYQRQRSLLNFTHMLTYSIMVEMGHDPFEGAQ